MIYNGALLSEQVILHIVILKKLWTIEVEMSRK